jgi:hypothetical protein
MMGKVILYCGDRNWSDPVPIQKSFDKEKPTIIIEGEARGADTMARREAHLRGEIEVMAFPARWNRYGRAAGPIRNELMLSTLLGYRDNDYEIKVVAFHSDLSQSRGTANMVALAKEAGVEVEIIV